MIKTKPCVFALKDRYEITVLVTEESIMRVKVGDKYYCDESNGIMKSGKLVHKVSVPMSELDAAGEYTVYERVMLERTPYFPKTGETYSYTCSFYPVKNSNARAYHIADTHCWTEEPVRAAEAYGDVDFLILNGDIQEDSSKLEYFDTIFELAAKITKGEKPVVFSRGNHDLRGMFAEILVDYTPTDNGNSYYTFKLGSVWGIVLDCGEDKDDTYEDYCDTICCHSFRQRQTKFIKDVINNADKEYNQADVKTRLVIVHNPFTEQIGEPFDIEEDIYREWALLLKENIKPHAMLCGHIHEYYVSCPGDKHDRLGNPSPVVVASKVDRENRYYVGCGFEFGDDSIVGSFTDSDGKTVDEFTLTK